MKNKIISILCFFILISLFFVNNSVFAYHPSFYSFSISEEAIAKLKTFDEYKSGEYYYWVRLWDNSTYEYYFIHANDLGDTYFYSPPNQNFKSSGSISNVKVYIVNSLYDVIDEYNLTDFTFDHRYYWTNKTWHYLANFTVYWDYEKSQSFFYHPPIVLPEKPVEAPITLAGIMKTAGEQATAEITQIILIVIMTTAGLIVLLIGLKKGLTVLMNGLRH